jgi:hypothetical protein
MANALTWVLLALGVVVGAFGGYLKAYLSQKGQNLATHEDINKLVDQVRAVTTTAKQIEAKISDDVWDRQKRWELKRDLLIDIVRKTIAMQVALQRLYAVRLTTKDSSDPENPARLEATHKSMAAFNDAVTEYDQGKLVACRSEFVTADAAGGVRVLPLDGPSIGGVGVDIAAELAS